jgi:hypothetical protein
LHPKIFFVALIKQFSSGVFVEFRQKIELGFQKMMMQRIFLRPGGAYFLEDSSRALSALKAFSAR